jgi:myo-inositol catabolism protein IolS
MKYRLLGDTGIKVSEIGFGCRNFGGKSIINGVPTTFGDITEEEGTKILLRCIELGINTFDTADTYSLGKSESRLGNFFHDFRSDVLIFTKGGAIPSLSTPPFEIDFSHNYLISALDRSLKRLQTDYVDVFQAHAPPRSESDFINLEKAFDIIKSENKAKSVGVSIGKNYNVGVSLIKRNMVDVLQITFSILSTDSVNELLSMANRNKIGIIVNRPLEEGIITDSFNTKKLSQDDFRKKYSSKFFKNKIKNVNLLKKSFSDYTLNNLALEYILYHSEISTCIPSSMNMKHIESNVNSSKINLTENDIIKIRDIKKKF